MPRKRKERKKRKESQRRISGPESTIHRGSSATWRKPRIEFAVEQCRSRILHSRNSTSPGGLASFDRASKVKPSIETMRWATSFTFVYSDVTIDKSRVFSFFFFILVLLQTFSISFTRMKTDWSTSGLWSSHKVFLFHNNIEKRLVKNDILLSCQTL